MGKIKRRWKAEAHLTASENHKGWCLMLNGDRVGEIYPLDEDGKEGRQYADSIPAKLNAFESGGAVERLIKHLPGRCSGCEPIVAELKALLPKKEG